MLLIYEGIPTVPHIQMRKKLQYRALFGDDRIDDDFDDENDPEYEVSQEDQPFDPDVFFRREVNARLRQYTNGDRDWLSGGRPQFCLCAKNLGRTPNNYIPKGISY